MNFPPDVEFHEDIRLLIYRPRGVIDEAAVKRTVAVLEELEEKLHRPFNRFSDTLVAGKVGDSRYRFDNASLCPVACLADTGFADQRSCFPGPERSCGLVKRTCRT